MDPCLVRQHVVFRERNRWFVAGRRRVFHSAHHPLNSKGSQEILEAGCGGGQSMEHLRCYARVGGVELAVEAVEYDQDRGCEWSWTAQTRCRS